MFNSKKTSKIIKTLKTILIIATLFPLRIYSQSSGTGFLISDNGHIVTCYHVIDNAKEIIIKGINGDFSKKYNAKIIVTDKTNDLAILKINCSLTKSISYSINWNTCEVGQEVFTLGYPLKTTMGEEIKLTNGIISSKSGFKGDITSYQISVPVQPGNSGCPLFDKNGYVIGIINAKYTGAENVGYAIKTNILSNLIQSISENIILKQTNSLIGKPLIEQVKLAKNYVLIIEVKNSSISNNIKDKPIVVKTKSKAKLRNKPDAFGNIIDYIPANLYVEIIGRDNKYWKVFYKGKIGYSHEMYFEETYETFIIKESEKFSKMPLEYQNNYETAIISQKAKMRNKPSAYSDIICYIQKGELIYIVGFSDWYWKIYYDGREGYLFDGMYFEVTFKMMRFK